MKINCAYDELVELSKLVPNPKNNNKHPKEQIERLAKIIDFQGQRSPVVVSNRSGFIVKGHGRLEAIKLLGWEKAAVDYQDYETEAQEYADMTADNQIALWAEFDTKMLLDELPNLDIDTDMLGMLELPEVDAEEPVGEGEEVDIENRKVKVSFNFKDSHEIIDTFLREISEKYPDLIYEVEIND